MPEARTQTSARKISDEICGVEQNELADVERLWVIKGQKNDSETENKRNRKHKWSRTFGRRMAKKCAFALAKYAMGNETEGYESSEGLQNSGK